jgi:homoserine dehydrogenase
MQEVNVGIIGLGNVGMGALTILTENADQIALKLGFPLRVKALCSRSILHRNLPDAAAGIFRTPADSA